MFKLPQLAIRAIRRLSSESPHHVPVMLNETLSYFESILANGLFVDMTFGAGGHTREILRSSSTVRVVALDRDPVAFEHATQLASEYAPGRLVPLLGRFSDLPALMQQHNISPGSVDGILFDFGCSSMQFDIAARGFSIAKSGPLDMRMDGNRIIDQPTAAEVLATADETDLARIIKIYGEEKNAKKIARAIVEARYTFRRLETTHELADLVENCFSDEFRLDKLQRASHTATKTFQALRIFVNNELNEINYGMLVAERYLRKHGRLVSITFHSLEDVIVKRHISGNVIDNVANPIPLKYCSTTVVHERPIIDTFMDTRWQPLNKHVLTPDAREVVQNPRSRSAKMRAAQKIK